MGRHETRMLSMSVSGENGLAGHHWRHQVDAAYRSRLSHVNPELTHLNVIIEATTDRDAYDARFGEALATYNDSQLTKGHPERQIPDYLAKLTDARATDERKVAAGKKKKVTVVAPFLDYVVQVGSHETVGKLDNAEYEAIYGEAFERIRERSLSDGGGIDWCQAVIHFDEEGGTPHLHISGIPFATGCKRGLETQASLGQALKALDLADKPALAEMIRDELEGVCEQHGILRDVMGCTERHLPTRQYKREQRELAEITAKRVEAETKLAQAEERLESVRRGIAAAEPAAESLTDSARYLKAHRDDGEREEELAGEVEGLRSALRASETECEQARERELAARERNRKLAGGRERLRRALRAAKRGFEKLRRMMHEQRTRHPLRRYRLGTVVPGTRRYQIAARASQYVGIERQEGRMQWQR